MLHLIRNVTSNRILTLINDNSAHVNVLSVSYSGSLVCERLGTHEKESVFDDLVIKNWDNLIKKQDKQFMFHSNNKVKKLLL